MLLLLALQSGLVLADAALLASARLPLRVEPAGHRALVSVSRAADDVPVPAQLREDYLYLPATTPFPVVVKAPGFEPVTVTRTDAAQKRVIILRAYGRLTGTLQRPKPSAERFAWLLKGARRENVEDIVFDVSDNGRFDTAVPAGIYYGLVLGSQSASRIRSGIIVNSGASTDLGQVLCEDTTHVSFRVIDGRSLTPIVGAKVIWDPPEMPNADAARTLLARRWSAVTDRKGVVTFPSVGPVPMPVRWHVEADGYAVRDTAVVPVRRDARFTVPDVRMRPQAVLNVVITPPRRGKLPAGKVIVAHRDRDDGSPYVAVADAPLKDGTRRFTDVPYGPARIILKAESGATLLYDDFSVETIESTVEVSVEPVEVRGAVTQNDKGVEGVRVVLADPHDASIALGRTKTDFRGEYSTTTYQRGSVFVYAILDGGPGTDSGNVSREVSIGPADREAVVDFTFNGAGLTIRVIDAKTGKPIARAQVDTRLEFGDASAQMGMNQTNAEGMLVLRNHKIGTANLTIHADGYRSSEATLPISDNNAETRVALEPRAAITGIVTSVDGRPVGGAVVSGGYRDVQTRQPAFRAITDAAGEFVFQSAPPPGTTFYIVAPGYALATVSVDEGRKNLLVLAAPSTGLLFLTTPSGPPEKPLRIVAAPHGREIIPIGPLEDLARANGMSVLQLIASSRDGSLVLPEFLAPGAYDLFLSRKGDEAAGQWYRYERIGNITTPLRPRELLTVVVPP